MVKQVTQIVLDREDFQDGLSAFENRIVERVLSALGGHNTGPNYRTRKATAEILSISLPTLDAWTKDGKITAHRIGGRVLYKQEDIDNALQRIRTTIHNIGA